MNKQEAIKELKKLQSGEAYDTEYIDFDCFDMAISALEKQIPKKVSYEDTGYNHYSNVNTYSCVCPSCALDIIEFDDDWVSDDCDSDDVEKMFHSSMVHHGYIGLNSYCNRCGQKLDWSKDIN